MNKTTVKKLPKSTIEIIITVPSEDIKKAYQKVLEEVVKNAELKGFRKGKAPKDLVEKNTDKNKIYQEAIKELLPQVYFQAVKDNNITPIIDPKIELVSPEKLSDLDNNVELVIKATTAEKPVVKLKNYKDQIKKIKTKDSIWVPGKEIPEKDKDKNTNKGPSLDEIIKTLLESTEVDLSDLLIENETNRLLSQTLDEIKKLGLTLEQYLANTGKTVENIRTENAQKAISDLKIEFILAEIAKEEKISVSQEEIVKVIEENKDPKAKEQLEKQKYLLSAIILQQKTLDFIKNL